MASGKSGTLTWGGSAVGKIQEITPSQNNNLSDESAMGDTGMDSWVPNLLDGTLNVRAIFVDDDTAQEAMIDASTSAAVVYRPLGAGSGLPEFTATMSVESWEMTHQKNASIEISFVLKGSLTQATDQA